jgi:cardiolipin synthase A/B
MTEMASGLITGIAADIAAKFRFLNFGPVLLAALISGGSLLFAPLPGFAATEAHFGVAPDNNQKLLYSTFASAKKLLQINIYEFKSLEIADELIARIQDGVTVHLLIETQPVFGMTTEGKLVLGRIHEAMKSSHNAQHRIFLLSGIRSGPNRNRRWIYNHAKYVIADGTQVQISSENFSPSGHPTPGKVGNRGWDVVVQDPTFVKTMTELFIGDTNPNFGDVITINTFKKLPFAVPSDSEARVRAPKARRIRPMPLGSGNIKRVTLIKSPQSMPALLKLMESADKSIDLQQMSLPMTWKSGATISMSPWLASLIKVAQKGVSIRVLLNDEHVWDSAAEDGEEPPATRNELTIDYLRTIARCYGLPLYGKVVDVEEAQISYIHNKGMIVDGNRTLISSINGTMNSMANNREVAVVVEGASAAKYYSRAFNHDWESSETFQRSASDSSRAGCPPIGETLTHVRPWIKPSAIFLEQ